MKHASWWLCLAGVLTALSGVAGAGSAPGGGPVVLASARAEPAGPAGWTGIEEGDAHRWLRDVHEAWESRDTARLAVLGVVSPAQGARLAAALAGYGALRVTFTNVTVAVEAGRTLVSYDRTDTDETGTALGHPRRTVELQRNGVGDVVAVRN